jgi:hypothetical protein
MADKIETLRERANILLLNISRVARTSEETGRVQLATGDAQRIRKAFSAIENANEVTKKAYTGIFESLLNTYEERYLIKNDEH